MSREARKLAPASSSKPRSRRLKVAPPPPPSAPGNLPEAEPDSASHSLPGRVRASASGKQLSACFEAHELVDNVLSPIADLLWVTSDALRAKDPQPEPVSQVLWRTSVKLEELASGLHDAIDGASREADRETVPTTKAQATPDLARAALIEDLGELADLMFVVHQVVVANDPDSSAAATALRASNKAFAMVEELGGAPLPRGAS